MQQGAANLPKTSFEGSVGDHSSLVGGSTAERRLGCAASYEQENKVPASVRNKSSSFADEGSALHACMEYIFMNDILADEVEDKILGREFGDPPYVMTQKLVDTAIMPCLDYIDALMDELADEGDFRFELETRCAMPGIPGAFGTTDFIFRTDKRSGIIDYKFGEGVPVKAYYIEQDGTERPNSQLCFYGRAAMGTIPHMFGDHPDWPVELHILQPRVREGDGFSMTTVTVTDLEAFRVKLAAAVEANQAGGAKPRKGPWCTFAACKTVCPIFTGALLDMSKLAVLQKNKDTARFDFEANLGVMLELWELAEEAGKAAIAQAATYLEAGGTIVDPSTGEQGWKLVPKRATEKVVDAAGMVRHAVGLGLPEADAYEPAEVKSPAQMGIALEPLMDKTEFKTKKDRTAEARRQLREFTTTASSGTTLARADDRRPEVIATPLLVNDLATKLAALQKG